MLHLLGEAYAYLFTFSFHPIQGFLLFFSFEPSVGTFQNCAASSLVI